MALFVANNGSLQTIKGIYYGMTEDLREIKSMFIKNRLTEGVDFKRYEWLKGDGYAYIILGTITPSVTITLKLDYNIKLEGLYPLGGRIFGNGNKKLAWNRVGREDEGLYFFYDGNTSVAWKAHRSVSDIYTITITDTDIAVNGIKKIYKGVGGNYNNYKLFHYEVIVSNSSTSTRAYSGSIMHFSDGAKNLVPCQLLKSIPATLDANKKARSAGECGMYDSISGKFYGNVANSGTFTVEGDVEPETHTGLQQIYQNKLIEGVDYETADWLKMDIPESIIIDMMSLPINSNNVEFKRNWIQITNSEYFRTSNYIYYITDCGDANDLCPMVWKITPSQFQYIGNIKLGLGLHTIITNSNGVTISGNYKVASLSWYGNPITYMTFNSMMIFNKHTIHLTSSIKVDGVTRYVPCKLLKTIPRNLDAQCKERVAGECGMIDLISGKFYGNVANSGTFTVENDNNE